MKPARRFERRDLLSTTCLAAAFAGLGSSAAIAEEPQPLWGAWAELGGQAGDEAAAFIEGFVPIGQDDDSIVFLDLRLSTADSGTGYSSFGIGVRQIVGEDLAIGASAFVDGIRTDNNNLYAGLGFGLEAFTSRFDLRIDGYVPFADEEQIGTPVTPGGVNLVDNSLVETFTLNDRVEAPLYGLGAELGALLDLPFRKGEQLRAYTGGYYYGRDGYDHQAGARLGLEYRVSDPFGLSGARLTFGAEAVYNQDNEVDALASARLRIPLFGGSQGSKKGEGREAGLSALQRQLDERVRRDAVVRVGEATRSSGTLTQAVVDPNTGLALGQIFFADGADTLGAGTQANPTDLADAIANAGVNGIIVGLGGNNTIDLTTGVTLLAGQQLIGGSGSIAVRLADGTTTTYNFGGTNGVIDGAAGIDTITLANNVTISDLTILGGNQAIAGNNVANVTLRNLNIQNTTGDGIHITGATNATIDTIAFSGIAGMNNLFLNNQAATISNITIDGGTNGIVIDNNTGTTTLSNISISNVTGDGLGFGNNTGAINASGVSVTNVGDDGIDIDGGGTFDFSGTTEHRRARCKHGERRHRPYRHDGRDHHFRYCQYHRRGRRSGAQPVARPQPFRRLQRDRDRRHRRYIRQWHLERHRRRPFRQLQ